MQILTKMRINDNFYFFILNIIYIFAVEIDV